MVLEAASFPLEEDMVTVGGECWRREERGKKEFLFFFFQQEDVERLEEGWSASEGQVFLEMPRPQSLGGGDEEEEPEEKAKADDDGNDDDEEDEKEEEEIL